MSFLLIERFWTDRLYSLLYGSRASGLDEGRIPALSRGSVTLHSIANQGLLCEGADLHFSF